MRRLLDASVHDARYAVRSMLRTPGFTTVAVLMIALGTGANAAMFSVIDAVMLQSPFVDRDRLAMVAVRTSEGRLTSALSMPQYRNLVETQQVFDALAAVVTGQRPIMTGLGEPRRFNVECFTADMFRVLGTQPAMGRAFTADDDRPGAPAVVVLSDQFWRREMAADPDAIGRVISLNNVPTTIVGIMPRGFGGPYSRNNNDGWMPGGAALAGGTSPGCASRPNGNVNPFARVKGGLTLDAASRQATDAGGITRLADWQGRTGGRIDLIALHEQTVGDLRTPLMVLLGAVGLVLLIACANVANLQMERVFGRRVETGVRLALGATRSRIVRQTLVENLLLSIAGGIAGLVIAAWTLKSLVALLPATMPHVNEIEISGRILWATIAVACASGIAVGIAPALQGTSRALMDDLRSSSRTSTAARSWTRRSFVVAQIALSLVLMVGAGLMISTFRTLRPSNPGFDPTDKLTATVRLQGAAAARSVPFFEQVLDRVRSIPGVRSAEGSSYLPMSGTVAVVSARANNLKYDTWHGVVTPGYFGEMAIPIVRGRSFAAADSGGSAPVTIVNEAFARKWWPGGEPLGQSVDLEYFDKRTETRQVVGVLRDTRSAGGDLKARPEIYVPLTQSPTPLLHVIVRASRPGDPRLVSELRTIVASIDPTQVVDRAIPMQEMLDARVSTWRFGAWLLGLFAGIAVLLASVGLAASIAWWVAQRTREIGVRMALGAPPHRVARLVLAQGLGLALAGVVLGLAGAALSTRLLEGWLFGVTPLDQPTFIASAIGMLVIAALATYVPVRRATRIDPLVALREQ
jgi:putative ABC transport system permease protein